MSEFCKKHPTTELQIKKGKRNQNFVACPECRPDLFADPKPKAAEGTPATEPQKKNGKDSTKPKWYDRPIL
jgi:hypothetical protein